MDNNEIKRTNRKALPKFLLFAIVCECLECNIGDVCDFVPLPR